jgi:MFS family permease
VTTTALAGPAISAKGKTATYGNKQRRLTLLVVALAFVLDLMDATILIIALPTIQHSMHASSSELTWMAAGYPLTFALLLITGGRLGDIFGYKRLFTVGVVGFLLSSLLVGVAWSPDVLIVSRLLQGGMAALMVPQVLSFVQLLYSAEERTTVTGMLGGLGMLATTIAPVVTGLLIKANVGGLSWRPVFLINVPICLAALWLSARHLPSRRSERQIRLDLRGTGLAISAVGLLVVPLVQGHDLGWPVWTSAMLIASVPTFAAFILSQRRADAAGRTPLVVLNLFRRKSFSIGLALSAIIAGTSTCFALTFTLLLQVGHAFTPIHTALTALFITAGIAPTAGALSKKVIPALGRYSLAIGALTIAGGMGAIGVIADSAGSAFSTWQIAPALVVIGVGMGLCFTALLPFVLSSVDPQDAGSASGTANAAQQVGGALGIALVGVVFFTRLSSVGSYGHAYSAAAWLEVGLLTVASALSLLLPRRISAEAYKPRL